MCFCPLVVGGGSVPTAIAPRKGKEEDKGRASQKPLVLWNGTEAEALEDHLSASHHFTDEKTESERGRGPRVTCDSAQSVDEEAREWLPEQEGEELREQAASKLNPLSPATVLARGHHPGAPCFRLGFECVTNKKLRVGPLRVELTPPPLGTHLGQV